MRTCWRVLLAGALWGCVGGEEVKDTGPDTGPDSGTDSGPDSGWDRARDRMRQGCGPDDGLIPIVEAGWDGDTCAETAPETAWVRIAFNEMSGPATAGTTYDLDSGDVSVWVFPFGGTDFVSPLSGTVALDAYTSREQARGRYSLVLDDGGPVTGEFWGAWCEVEMDPCG